MFKSRRQRKEKPADKSIQPTVVETKKVEEAVKSKEWIQLYRTVDEHCIALKVKYNKAPKIDKKMSLKELQKVYDEIHQNKYGHL